MKKKVVLLAALMLAATSGVSAETKEKVPYGDFEQWITRTIKESAVIGGKSKTLYEIGPTQTITGNKAYTNLGGSPWATSNVYAKVAGVVKGSNAVFPEQRSGGNKCVKMSTIMEKVKALGIINMDVVCQGAFLLGSLPEPIKDTKNPMSKVLYGIPFTGRPAALVLDYKADVGHEAVRGTGFSKLKSLGYPDYPEIAVILQKRWEDEEGNIHALRVGTGIERITENIPDWINGHRIDIHYGDISGQPFFKDYMGLNNDPERAFHTLNGKGDNVIVQEEGWAAPEEQPNFMIIKFISSCGQAFYGGVGNTLWIDNIHIEM